MIAFHPKRHQVLRGAAVRMLRLRGARWLARFVGLLPYLVLFGGAIFIEFHDGLAFRLLFLTVVLVMLRWP